MTEEKKGKTSLLHGKKVNIMTILNEGEKSIGNNESVPVSQLLDPTCRGWKINLENCFIFCHQEDLEVSKSISIVKVLFQLGCNVSILIMPPTNH